MVSVTGGNTDRHRVSSRPWRCATRLLNKEVRRPGPSDTRVGSAGLSPVRCDSGSHLDAARLAVGTMVRALLPGCSRSVTMLTSCRKPEARGATPAWPSPRGSSVRGRWRPGGVRRASSVDKSRRAARRRASPAQSDAVQRTAHRSCSTGEGTGVGPASGRRGACASSPVWRRPPRWGGVGR